MRFSSWLRNATSRRARRGLCAARRAAARFRPQLEALENRVVPSVWTVTSLADNGPGSLRWAVEDANHGIPDQVQLIKIEVPGTITLESPLRALTAPNIDIVGLGDTSPTTGTVIQRDQSRDQFQIFRIAPGVTAGLSEMALAHGDSGFRYYYGGAIENFGDLTLDHCALSQNRAGFGGAVANWNADSELGPADVRGAHLTLNDCSFTDNTARYEGGAIYTEDLDGYGGAPLTVSGGSFTNNSAKMGGAISAENVSDFYYPVPKDILTIFWASFTNNSASDSGAIHNGFDRGIVQGASFTNNSSSGFGGGIGNSTTLTVRGCTFTGNSAVSGGGGIANGASLTLDSANNFVGNSCPLGGAIDNTGTLTATAFFSNNSGVDGGALANAGNATLNGCTFTGNTANSGGAADGGGAIMNQRKGTLTVEGFSNFNGNSAFYGAAIRNNGTATVSRTTFNGNKALYGGALMNEGTLGLDASTLKNGFAAVRGGGLCNDGSATLSQCDLSGNTSDSGGAIWSSGTLNVQGGSSLNGNNTGETGGAVFNSGTMSVTQATFSNNSSGSGGAVFNAPGGSLTLNAGAEFTLNSSLLVGGAIANLPRATLTLNPGTDFKYNTAQVGGAISNAGTLNALDDTFTGNAAFRGGAVANFASATINFCTFEENSATYMGGAIYNSATMTVAGCRIDSNPLEGPRAQHGGGIASSGQLTVKDCDITNNAASVSGGGIYTFGGGTTSVTGSVIIKNTPDDTFTEPGSTLIVSNSDIGNQK
jgi:predicted outer membrane repeat protein